ncbi:unnamed protein product [Rotaria socialis]|uniref:Sulfotransferase domain-containing protein n=1 Tax=Rotaria socialis TaxID=392032 RepID=A0A817WTK0_9BILA|nr:unnamed protein product [Rotaria socialis]CAF3389866.1 unnamed protein product [Rotaria socialis]CAF3424102.1 unnamed protein product [Rotaria socialis]CAF3717725.1 unnamed protein product [Rotaria socialis]CAF4544434.1 unnamed protein product [Rotaria socialis]
MSHQLTQDVYQIVDGTKVPYHFNAETVRSALNYEAQPDDIFIVSFPKSGTTWIENVVFGLLNDGKAFDDDMGYYLSQTPYAERFGQNSIMGMVRPGSIKMHVPFNYIPHHPKAKYVCIIRNPKDVCVSFYHFVREIPLYAHFNAKFNTFFEDFIHGNTPYGDYFEHLRSICDHKDDTNVLLISYEQMQVDLTGVVLKVAEFLNINQNKEVLEKILEHASFTYMKQKFDKAHNTCHAQKSDKSQTFSFPLTFVRTGVAGNWSSQMNDEQVQLLDQKMADFMREIPGLNELLWPKAKLEEH